MLNMFEKVQGCKDFLRGTYSLGYEISTFVSTSFIHADVYLLSGSYINVALSINLCSYTHAVFPGEL